MIDSNNNDTEIPEDQPEEQALQLKVKDFACRSNAKAKPQRREPVISPSIFPMNERKWIDIEPGNYSLSLCVRGFEESNPSSSTLSNSTTRRRRSSSILEDQEFLQSQSPEVFCWSNDRWKACLAAGGGAKRIYQYCTDISGTIVYFRALQGHSGRNIIDPSLQDNVVIQSGFLQHIYHIGCAF